jgi:hypothetical protein
MVRLTDDLAALRRLYTRPIVTMPDVLVIDVAPPYRHPSLGLGRYYGVLIESCDEQREFDAFLQCHRPAPVAPNLLDRRPSAVSGDRITIATYAPPAPDWPWILLCHWPARLAALVPAQGDHFARGAYTHEMYEDAAGTIEGARRLLDSLARHGVPPPTMVSPDLGASGRA